MRKMKSPPPWVVALLEKSLSAVEFRVWAYLYWRQGRHGSAWPSQRAVGEALGLTPDGVRKITRRLETKGWLEVTPPAHTAPGNGLRYRVWAQENHLDSRTGEHPDSGSGVSAKSPRQRSRNHPDGCPQEHYTGTLTCAQTEKLAYNWERFAFTGIPEDLMRQWAEAYPLADVPAEILKAAVWCRNNAEKARGRDWERFLGAWIAQAQRNAESSGRTKQELQSNESDQEDAAIDAAIAYGTACLAGEQP